MAILSKALTYTSLAMCTVSQYQNQLEQYDGCVQSGMLHLSPLYLTRSAILEEQLDFSITPKMSMQQWSVSCLAILYVHIHAH